MIRLKDLFKKHRILVLMYHRIADIPVDPWDLAVSGENFEQHLQVINQKVIPLQEVICQLKQGRLTRSGYCITFDDGYTDNFLNARPVLEQYDCPATFFISSGFTGAGQMFWWDMLTRIFLELPRLPRTLDIHIGTAKLFFVLENEGRLRPGDLEHHKAWKWPAPAPSQRCDIYLKVWQAIRDLSDHEIDNAIGQLIAWSGFGAAEHAEDFPMTQVQLQSLAASGAFTFGVHGVTHPALGSHSADHQRSELAGCRDQLSGIYDNFINAVAYPYGHYNADTTAVMKQEKFDAGFTTQEKAVSSSSNIYELGRIKVNNLSRTEFQKLLHAWDLN